MTQFVVVTTLHTAIHAMLGVLGLPNTHQELAIKTFHF
jgi:hypothetical protein